MKRDGLIFSIMGLLFIVQMAPADWTPTRRLTWTSGASAVPQVAVDSIDIIHLVWPDYTPGNPEIFYRRSKDKGTTWTLKQRLTWTSLGAYYAVIAADASSRIHLVLESPTSDNLELYYKKSTNAGADWLTSRRLTWTSGDSYVSAISVGPPGHLHVVWHDNTPGNNEIYYKKSTDAGNTWASSKRLTWTSGNSRWSDIAVDLIGRLHLVWCDDTSGNEEIYYRRSTDGGTTWSTSRNLSLAVGDCRDAAVAVDSSGGIHVVWDSITPGNWEIYHKKSTDGGITWSANRRITWSSGNSYTPSIAADASGNLHVVWFDDKPGNFEIYYKMSPDGGGDWSTSRRLSWNSGRSEYPVIAADTLGNLHVAWDDDTPGNYEIYYRKNEH